MSNRTRCCFVVEARLLRNGSAYWDPRQSFPKDHWDECLHVFGRITVLARTLPTQDSATGGVVFPAKVSVGELPYYIGPVNAGRKSLALIRAARLWARRGNVFVLRVPGFVPSLVWFWLRRYQKPYAVEVLGDPKQVFEVIQHPLRRFWRLVYSRAQQAMIRKASAIMYVSRTLLELYPGPTGRPSVVISDARLTDQVFKGPRTFLSIPKPVRLVHVGNMEQPYKGHDYLIKAIAICIKSGNSLQLTLVGDGRLRSNYQSFCNQLGLSELVVFRGAVTWGPELFQILDEADLFVLCSLTEGLPKSLLEAMARGLPAIGSNVGGIPELLTPEVLVPAADERRLANKIMQLTSDPALLARQSLRNYQEALKYHHNRLSNARIEFYRRFKSSVDREPPT